MHGRDEALARAEALLADDIPALVIGEPGIGKTALMREAGRRSGRPLFEGGALGALQWIPYAPLRRALGDPPAITDAVAIASWAAARVGGGVLLLDDLQWIDPATLEALPLLAGQIGLIVAMRPGPATDPVIQTLERRRAEVLELEPLDDLAAGAMVAELAPDLSPTRRLQLVRAAAGNPLHLEELATAPNGGIPTTLQRSVAARLRRLSHAGVEAAGLLALLGRPASTELLGPATSEVVAAGLARHTDGLVAIRHLLVADAVLGGLDDETRTTLHRTLAGRLTDPPERIRHMAAAGDTDMAVAAALAAAKGETSPGRRAALLGVAAASVTGPEGNGLRLRAASALLEARDGRAALAVLDGVAGADGESTARAHLFEARASWYLGDNARARAAVDAGLATTGMGGTVTEVELRTEQARLATMVDWNAGAGRRLANAALELAASIGAPEHRARHVLGAADLLAGDHAGIDQLRLALRDGRQAGDLETEFGAADTLLTAHAFFEGPGPGLALGQQMVERAQQLGLAGWERHFQAMMLLLRLERSQPATVVDEAADLLAEVMDPRSRAVAGQALASALISMGDHRSALEQVGSLVRDATGDPLSLGWALYLRAEANLWAGLPHRAVADIDECIASGLGDYPLFTMCRLTRAWASFEAGMAPGPPIEQSPFPYLASVSLETSGLHRLAAGEAPDVIAGVFAEAASAWAPFSIQYELRARWMHGELLRRAGLADEARRSLLAVEVDARAAGCASVTGRVERSLRLAGVRRSAPSSSRDGLSARQREVVALAGAGLSNNAIAHQLGLSRSTVAGHLALASDRLGAMTRQQAAALLASAPRRAAVRPLVVVEGTAELFGHATKQLREEGWDVRGGWAFPRLDPSARPERLVLAGRVATGDEASNAVLAAVAGAGVLAWATGPHVIVDDLLDDLRRFGPIDHRSEVAAEAALDLSDEAWELLRPLCEGMSLVDTARMLHIGRRTADRRLAAIRRSLGVATTAEAVVVATKALRNR